MTDDVEYPDPEAPVRLFGDPRSALIERGPDRRVIEGVHRSAELTNTGGLPQPIDPTKALRHARGDGVATLLLVAGILAFGATVVTGSLILYNAKNVGAFSNPWDSTRVAIGVSVLAVGLVQSLILVGLSRVTSYLVAILRIRAREARLPSGERQN